jgi:hypothetical protein
MPNISDEERERDYATWEREFGRYNELLGILNGGVREIGGEHIDSKLDKHNRRLGQLADKYDTVHTLGPELGYVIRGVPQECVAD